MFKFWRVRSQENIHIRLTLCELGSILIKWFIPKINCYCGQPTIAAVDVT